MLLLKKVVRRVLDPGHLDNWYPGRTRQVLKATVLFIWARMRKASLVEVKSLQRKMVGLILLSSIYHEVMKSGDQELSHALPEVHCTHFLSSCWRPFLAAGK